MRDRTGYWRLIAMSLGLVVLVVSAVAVGVFVPLVDPPEPPWPVFCQTGETPEKVTVLEFVRRKAWRYLR